MPEIVYSTAETYAAIERLAGVLTIVQQQIGQLQQQQQQQGAQMATNAEVIKSKIDELKADVAAGKTVQASAIALLQGITAQNSALVQQLKDAIAAGLSPAELTDIVAKFDETNTEMDAQRQALADAVTANTPTPSA